MKNWRGVAVGRWGGGAVGLYQARRVAEARAVEIDADRIVDFNRANVIITFTVVVGKVIIT